MSKRSAEVGPEPPKRPQSGYGQFFAEKRKEISATLLKEGVVPAKVMTSSAKRAGEMWKVLGETKQKPYNEKTVKLMAAYTQEMEAFKTANPDFKKAKKDKKGDKPPARPVGAYGTWMADNRPMLTEMVMKKHSVDKGKAFFMLYQEGKPLYEALPAAEKKQCEEKAEAAKVKFQAEFKEWKEKNKGAKVASGETGPKRPLGVYAQWLADNRPMLTEKVMKKSGVDKAKAFLMLYKEGKPFYDALPAEEKKKCEEKAEAAKVKFQAEHKEWKEKNKGAKAANVEDEDDDGDEDEYIDEGDEDEDDEVEVKPSTAKKAKKADVSKGDDVTAQVDKLGYTRQFKALVENPKLAKTPPSKVLEALTTANGAVVAARKALLGA